MGFIGKQPAKAAITSSDITDGIVTADKLASDSVTTAKIADNGVTTAKINADAVTDAKIADDVVGSEHLTAGEVDTTALGADAVTAAKIADDAISDEHLDPTAITGQTAETSIADDDLILVSDTSASAALKKMTRANFVSGVGGDNTPAFFAYLSSNQSVSATTYTKVQFNAELFDSDNAYDNSTNYRFTVPSGEGGKYVVGVALRKNNFAGSRFQAAMRVNGSERTILEQSINTDAYFTVTGNTIMTLSASDYIEVFAYHNDGGSRSLYGDSSQIDTFFYAYKLIGL